jgi:hypothetical protein
MGRRGDDLFGRCRSSSPFLPGHPSNGSTSQSSPTAGKRRKNPLGRVFAWLVRIALLFWCQARLQACDACFARHPLASSCRPRGFSCSFGAGRIADGATWRVPPMQPERPIRQWVLCLPILLDVRGLSRAAAMRSKSWRVDKSVGVAESVKGGLNSASHHWKTRARWPRLVATRRRRAVGAEP